MSTEVHIVRSFTNEEMGGNRAGVVIDRPALLSEYRMSCITKAIGASETAFARGTPHASSEMLFFKGNGDPIPLCGHALIGALAVLAREKMFKLGSHVIQTLSGEVEGRVGEDGVMWYGQGPSQVTADAVAAKDVVRAFSYLPHHAIGSGDLQPQIVRTIPPSNLRDMLVPVAAKEYLDAIQMRREQLEQLCHHYGVDGVHLFSHAENPKEPQAYARNFSLGMTREGVGEDLATGTLAGALACVLYERSALRGDIHNILFLQGPPGHHSALRVRLMTEGKAIARADVGGRVQYTGTQFIV